MFLLICNWSRKQVFEHTESCSILVCVISDCIMLLNSLRVCKGVLFICMFFPSKMLQYIVTVFRLWGWAEVGRVWRWYLCELGLVMMSLVHPFLLPSPPHSFPPAPQQHPQSLSELRPARAQSLPPPATCGREKSERRDSAPPPPVPGPPWPRTAGTETVGVSSVWWLLQPARGRALRLLLLETRRAKGCSAPASRAGRWPPPSGSLSGGRNGGRAGPVEPASGCGAKGRRLQPSAGRRLPLLPTLPTPPHPTPVLLLPAFRQHPPGRLRGIRRFRFSERRWAGRARVVGRGRWLQERGGDRPPLPHELRAPRPCRARTPGWRAGW